MFKKIIQLALLGFSIWMYFSPPFFIDIIGHYAPSWVATLILLDFIKKRLIKVLNTFNLYNPFSNID